MLVKLTPELLDGAEATEDDPHIRTEADWHDRPVAEAKSVHGLVGVGEGFGMDFQQPWKASHQREDVWAWFEKKLMHFDPNFCGQFYELLFWAILTAKPTFTRLSLTNQIGSHPFYHESHAEWGFLWFNLRSHFLLGAGLQP